VTVQRLGEFERKLSRLSTEMLKAYAKQSKGCYMVMFFREVCDNEPEDVNKIKMMLRTEPAVSSTGPLTREK
jgi:hypothetical protein